MWQRWEYAKGGTVGIRTEHVTSLASYVDKKSPGVVVHLVDGSKHVVKGSFDEVYARIKGGESDA